MRPVFFDRTRFVGDRRSEQETVLLAIMPACDVARPAHHQLVRLEKAREYVGRETYPVGEAPELFVPCGWPREPAARASHRTAMDNEAASPSRAPRIMQAGAPSVSQPPAPTGGASAGDEVNVHLPQRFGQGKWVSFRSIPVPAADSWLKSCPKGRESLIQVSRRGFLSDWRDLSNLCKSVLMSFGA